MGSILESIKKSISQQRVASSGDERNEKYEITPSKVEAQRFDSAPIGDWLAFYQARLVYWTATGRQPEAVVRWAWRQTADQWFLRHGTHSPAWACAGCGEQLTGDDVIVLPFRQRAHGRNECIVAYGRRWQGEARDALERCGVPTPAADEQGMV